MARGRKSRRTTRSVRVKKHSRSPRGPNQGKPRPSVRPHRRRNPVASSYPRAMNRKGHKPTNPSGRH